MPLHNLILIGCGPHYRERYHSLIEKRGCSLKLIVDLKEKESEIREFFKDRAIVPERMHFLEKEEHSFDEIDSLLNPIGVDAVLLCTEPKSRFIYLKWAAKHHLPIFMDKPAVAFRHDSSQLLSTFQEMVALHPTSVVSCERRAHPGYTWLENYLRKWIDEIGIPITAIDLHFSGGIWNLPHEYHQRENHPFKYGYGILLHSGYHYIDLLCRLFSLNAIDDYDFQAIPSYPKTQIDTIPSSIYEALGAKKSELLPLNYGESELMLIGQGKRKGEVLTNFSLKLFGTSLCLRKDDATTPHLKGKVRQEMLTLHLGPLCSIHLSSHPLHKLDPVNHPKEEFRIVVMNHPLTKRPPLETHSFTSQKGSLNGEARRWQLNEFLEERDGNSLLKSHEPTMKFIHDIYMRYLPR